ncbi:TolC family protein [Sulfitobacter aestuarii]|uniref:TolC family protein n=1 Tax=Sulfitobacter aestuarii TaxID=2161676 RepID=A0ABW5TZS4_9RHOB
MGYRMKTTMILLPLVLAACSAPQVPTRFSARDAGFDTVQARTSKAIGKRTVWAQSQAETVNLSKQVRAMVQGKTISAETAVQAALLNNKGLQASYAAIGLSAAEAWQQSTPENPVVSIGLMGIGAPEVGLYRAIESAIAVNLLDARTRKERVALAEAAFQQAQMSAVNDTLSLANETREAWINAVGAFETLSYLKKAAATADASAELAQQLGKTGALNKAGQAREQAFNAEMAGQVARARLDAQLAKEQLTRLMGLWGADVNYYVPDALPSLPNGIRSTGNVEQLALANRVDLEVARLGLAATARAFGLSDATRTLTDLEVIAGVELEKEVEDGDKEIVATPQVEFEFAIPIFDSGKARLRSAELSYLQAANVLAERAVNVRSQARAAAASYRSSHQIAQHYRQVVLPLRRTIEEEALLSNNGMITSTFDLLNDTREKLSSELEAANAKRDFWLASAGLSAAIYGGGSGAGGGGEAVAIAAGGGGAGH